MKRPIRGVLARSEVTYQGRLAAGAARIGSAVPGRAIRVGARRSRPAPQQGDRRPRQQEEPVAADHGTDGEHTGCSGRTEHQERHAEPETVAGDPSPPPERVLGGDHVEAGREFRVVGHKEVPISSRVCCSSSDNVIEASWPARANAG
jgi:hypothetical protein